VGDKEGVLGCKFLSMAGRDWQHVGGWDLRVLHLARTLVNPTLIFFHRAVEVGSDMYRKRATMPIALPHGRETKATGPRDIATFIRTIILRNDIRALNPLPPTAHQHD
jgi:hypothetical protein